VNAGLFFIPKTTARHRHLPPFGIAQSTSMQLNGLSSKLRDAFEAHPFLRPLNLGHEIFCFLSIGRKIAIQPFFPAFFGALRIRAKSGVYASSLRMLLDIR